MDRLRQATTSKRLRKQPARGGVHQKGLWTRASGVGEWTRAAAGGHGEEEEDTRVRTEQLEFVNLLRSPGIDSIELILLA
jgi:hypothetical protein